MAELKPTRYVGKITWLGRVARAADLLWSEPATAIFAGFNGAEGDIHLGLTRPSCSRMTAQYQQCTEIRNTRQFSVLSKEELAEVAATMGLDALSPSLLGATMV